MEVLEGSEPQSVSVENPLWVTYTVCSWQMHFSPLINDCSITHLKYAHIQCMSRSTAGVCFFYLLAPFAKKNLWISAYPRPTEVKIGCLHVHRPYLRLYPWWAIHYHIVMSVILKDLQCTFHSILNWYCERYALAELSVIILYIWNCWFNVLVSGDVLASAVLFFCLKY